MSLTPVWGPGVSGAAKLKLAVERGTATRPSPNTHRGSHDPWIGPHHQYFPNEATDDFATGLTLLDPALVIVLSSRVDPQASEHDAMQRSIGLPVAAAVEATVLPASRETLDGTDPRVSRIGGVTLRGSRQTAAHKRAATTAPAGVPPVRNTSGQPRLRGTELV